MQLYMSWYIISFLALSLLLKYSLFFSSTPVLTSSIDVVFVLSILCPTMRWTSNIRGRPYTMGSPYGVRVRTTLKTSILWGCNNRRNNMSPRNCFISWKIIPSKNIYYWWYGSHKVFYVAFPITAIGLPQNTCPHKTQHGVSFQGLC